MQRQQLLGGAVKVWDWTDLTRYSNDNTKKKTDWNGHRRLHYYCHYYHIIQMIRNYCCCCAPLSAKTHFCLLITLQSINFQFFFHFIDTLATLCVAVPNGLFIIASNISSTVLRGTLHCFYAFNTCNAGGGFFCVCHWATERLLLSVLLCV